MNIVMGILKILFLLYLVFFSFFFFFFFACIKIRSNHFSLAKNDGMATYTDDGGAQK